MMQAMQEHFSVSYDRSRLRERNHTVSILLDISNFLASSLDLQHSLDGALERVLDRFGFDAGRIYLMDPEGAHLNLAAHNGINPEGLEMVKLEEGFSGKAARTRSFLAGRVRDLEDRARVNLLLGKGYETIVCVPLIALDEVVGVMNLATARLIELDRRKTDLLMVVGNQIATAVKNAQLHEDNQTKIKELKEKKETIKFFAYSASHDLKCPAVGLQGLAEMFQKKYGERLDAQGRELCNQIVKTSRHIMGLTERINAYVATKEYPLKVERVDVNEIIETIRNEFVHALEARSIEWVVPSAQIRVLADRLALVRFFQNCVDNAIKYGGAGLSRIQIGHEENAESHVFSVRDDGIGLNQADAEGLFQLFRRHENSKGVEGCGLGLSIVKELAERQGGKAWVETKEGHGAAFYLAVPKRLRSALRRFDA